jgi:T5SS/PEP-CTERM-associated repeat protein
LAGVAAAAALVISAASAWAGVVATNDAVPWPQLVGPEGTSDDPTIFLFDGYTRNFDLVGQGLDIGTYHPYIALHIVNRSVITSSRIWFLGGDYPNKVDESSDPNAYPGHQTMILDNSSMTTGEFRVGSKSRNNTLIVRNQAKLSVGKGLFIDHWDGTANNSVVVTGAGSLLSVTNGSLYVGYGNSSNETLSVLDGALVTVGTSAAPQWLRMRSAHNSTVTVSGAGSTLWVTGGLTLGENSTHCHNNRLIVADGGVVKIDGTLSSASNATKSPNRVRLANGGAIALKGSHDAHPLLSTLLAAGESAAASVGPGTGELAGYTVWQAAAGTASKNTSCTRQAGP